MGLVKVFSNRSVESQGCGALRGKLGRPSWKLEGRLIKNSGEHLLSLSKISRSLFTSGENMLNWKKKSLRFYDWKVKSPNLPACTGSPQHLVATDEWWRHLGPSEACRMRDAISLWSETITAPGTCSLSFLHLPTQNSSPVGVPSHRPSRVPCTFRLSLETPLGRRLQRWWEKLRMQVGEAVDRLTC